MAPNRTDPPTISFIWTDQCQKAFEILKNAVMKSSILFHPDQNKLHMLFSNSSKYAWSAVLTHRHKFIIKSKTIKHQHPITCINGFSKAVNFTRPL